MYLRNQFDCKDRHQFVVEECKESKQDKGKCIRDKWQGLVNVLQHHERLEDIGRSDEECPECKEMSNAGSSEDDVVKHH